MPSQYLELGNIFTVSVMIKGIQSWRVHSLPPLLKLWNLVEREWSKQSPRNAKHLDSQD